MTYFNKVQVVDSNGSGVNEYTDYNEDNVISEQLANGGSIDQAVDGSSTAVVFSSTVVPAGKIFIAKRIIFYMEGAESFNSNKFGDQTALTNGWLLRTNGVAAFLAKQNRQLAQYMFDMQGVKIFGKENKTMIGRFSFDKITPGAQGLSIAAGNTLDTVVQDDLSGLTYLEAMIQGYYKDT